MPLTPSLGAHIGGGCMGFTIALVQNQSEMAHYGYADARPLLTGLGYKTELFTAANIHDLSKFLESDVFDAVVVGSNALNDKTIRSTMFDAQFIEGFREWLSRGHGALILHQLRLSTFKASEATLRFLPSPFNDISAKVRPTEERSFEGRLDYGAKARSHILLLYPNRIFPEDIQKNALNFRSLPGLYWHYWEKVSLSYWEILLVDKREDTSLAESDRPLVVASRGPETFRIVCSSLTLDWQKQREFLENILTYVVEGHHTTAILADENKRSLAFEYLLGTLRSRKYPFKVYFSAQGHSLLRKHIEDEVHQILILGPFVATDTLSPQFLSSVEEKLGAGFLKIIDIEEGKGVSKFTVSGGERGALRILQESELYIRKELRDNGYIDGSFWSTVETLQVLQALSPTYVKSRYQVGKALQKAKEHDKDGSYDEVFGVTNALLWLRGTFLGVEDRDTQSSARWIRKNLSHYEPREQMLAYLTLYDLGMISGDEKRQMEALLSALNVQVLNETDIIVYLRAVLKTRFWKVVPELVSALEHKQLLSGAWVDLATTATVVTTLIEVLKALQEQQAAVYSEVKHPIEQMMFRGIIYIQEGLEAREYKYPWENKASTTLKCVQAWLRFDEMIDFPVYELVQTLTRYHAQTSLLSSGRQALAILEELKQDNVQLREKLHVLGKEKEAISSENKLFEKRIRKSWKYLLLAIVSLYLLITVSVAYVLSHSLLEFAKILEIAFFKSWAVHAGILGLIAAYLAVPWEKIRQVLIRQILGGQYDDKEDST